MLGWFRRFTHPLGQIDPYLARKRLRPVHVRAYRPADFDRCIELYRLNEPSRFPPGVLPQFERALQKTDSLFLIIEEGETIVGCGGVSIFQYEAGDVGFLSFGLIHPECHRRGLGSTLLLARLAMLPEDLLAVGLQAVPASRSFYAKFGFLVRKALKFDPDWECSLMSAFLSADDRQLCDILLRRAGVTLPQEELIVPVRPMQGVSKDAETGGNK